MLINRVRAILLHGWKRRPLLLSIKQARIDACSYHNLGCDPFYGTDGDESLCLLFKKSVQLLVVRTI